MTQLTENLTVWQLWYFKAVTSYRGKRFQVPTRLTTVTRQTGEYKVDLTRHPKFPLAFGELASGRFPHCILWLSVTCAPIDVLPPISVTCSTCWPLNFNIVSRNYCYWRMDFWQLILYPLAVNIWLFVVFHCQWICALLSFSFVLESSTLWPQVLY